MSSETESVEGRYGATVGETGSENQGFPLCLEHAADDMDPVYELPYGPAASGAASEAGQLAASDYELIFKNRWRLKGPPQMKNGDKGATSGLVNVAHQLGGSIGLSVLIVVFAANADSELTGAAQMSHQVSAVFIGAAVMNMLALTLTASFILAGQSQESQSVRCGCCVCVSTE